MGQVLLCPRCPPASRTRIASNHAARHGPNGLVRRRKRLFPCFFGTHNGRNGICLPRRSGPRPVCDGRQSRDRKGVVGVRPRRTHRVARALVNGPNPRTSSRCSRLHDPSSAHPSLTVRALIDRYRETGFDTVNRYHCTSELGVTFQSEPRCPQRDFHRGDIRAKTAVGTRRLWMQRVGGDKTLVRDSPRARPDEGNPFPRAWQPGTANTAS